MLALRFTQTKNFMERLLLSPAFVRFLLSEASITTAATVSIDGHFHPDFYPEADEEENAPVRAAKAGADAGCHNDQCCFHTFSS